MKLRKIAGEYRYAVAVREGSDLWLALWVKRSKKGEFFVLLPRKDGRWDNHTSYHLDGTRNMKSRGRHIFEPSQRQPLTGQFRGTESLWQIAGHDPKSVGQICVPTDFTAVVEVPPGVLGPHDGAIAVDLVEPGHMPNTSPLKIAQQQVFCDTVPRVVITVGFYG